MKKLFVSLFVALGLSFAGLAYAEDVKHETKKVCVDKVGKDGKPVAGKDGKPAQDCKDVKVHKKLEGTPVPDKAAKPAAAASPAASAASKPAEKK